MTPRPSLDGAGGFVLPLVIIVLVAGSLILVPIVRYLTTATNTVKNAQDTSLDFYAADAAVHAVVGDLRHGADGASYTPPVVSLNDISPQVTIQVQETEALSRSAQKTAVVGQAPVVVEGSYDSGTYTNLNADDTSYYALKSTTTPPAIAYEATSESLVFDEVSFVAVNYIGQTDKGPATVQFFVYNPNDPAHTQGGYNPLPDATIGMEAKSVDYGTFFFLSQSDLDYVNSLSPKKVKVKVRGYRYTNPFTIRSDVLTFDVAGSVSSETKYTQGSPTIVTGTLDAGSGASMTFDDGSFYEVRSTGTPETVRWDGTSQPFGFTAVDGASFNWAGQVNQIGVGVNFYVYNPTDPAHTNGGYATEPDITTTFTVKDVDRFVSFQLSAADTAYISSLPTKTMKLRIEAVRASGGQFELKSDLLTYTATSSTTPLQTVDLPQLQYFDPGVRDPDFASVPANKGYLVTLYDVRPGLLAVNWAYAPSADARILVYRGNAVDSNGAIIPPGRINTIPPGNANDLVVQGKSSKVTAVATKPLVVDAGVYTIVFFNDSNSLLTTEPFAASALSLDTWVWAIAYRDYLISSSAGKVGIKAVVRLVPGRSEPPSYPWARTEVSWITSEPSIISWELAPP